MTPQQQRALELRARGLSLPQIAAEMGIKERGLRRLLARARHYDAAVEAAMNAVGTEMVPTMAWLKTKPDDAGNAYSVLLRPAAEETESPLDRIVAAFDNIAPIKPIASPAFTVDRLMSSYMAFDWHLGQHSWGKETGGQDYDLALGESDLRKGLASIIDRTPNSKTAVLIFGGDNLHVDDDRQETPANRNKLNADGRYQKIVDTAIDAMAFCVETLAAKHEEVEVVVLRGNHDPHAHIALKAGLRQRYRENHRILVWGGEFDIYMRQFGNVGLFANHGDRSKPAELTLEIADKCPFYSRVYHRYLFTGHRHRESAQALPGMKHEGLSPIAPADAYGSRFSGRRHIYSTTFDMDDGIVARAYDTMSRRDVFETARA